MEEKNPIGYRKHYYGLRNDSNRQQCFHCKYGKCIENDREQVQCSKWNMVTSEDDVCNAFELQMYWAYNLTEEDRARRNRKLQNFKEECITENSNSNKKEGCYIATAVYGGYDEPQVLILRKYRDEVLKKTILGQLFIKVYYVVSPKLVKSLKSCIWLNEKVRNILDNFVERIKNKYL